MRYVVSTPRRVFVFDADRATIADLLVGGSEYYGISWTPESVLLGCADASAGPAKLRGRTRVVELRAHDARTIADDTEHAHQIEVCDDLVVVADTGHDRLGVYRLDGSLVAHADLGGTGVDTPTSNARGRHFNSVHRTGDRLWVVAHNHDQPSQLWELSWPTLGVVAVHDTAAGWAHNVWHGEHGTLMCDSRAGALHRVEDGATLWAAPDAGLVTRGLSVGPDFVAVGRSSVGSRQSRFDSDGGLWLLDRKTLTVVDEFVFPRSGAVHEVRQLDSADECHTGVLPPADLVARIRGAHDVFNAQPVLPTQVSSPPKRRFHHIKAERGITIETATTAFAHEATLVRERAESISDGIDVLVWMPYVSPGGGARLILSLLPPLARSRGVRSVRLAVPRSCVAASEWPELRGSGVSVVEVDVADREGVPCAWLHRDGNDVFGIEGDEPWLRATVGALSRDCDVIYVPWPHRNAVPAVEVPIVCTVQDTTLIDFPEGLGAVSADEERLLTAAWVERSAAVVVSSENTRRGLQRLFGDRAGDAHVIHHAIRPRPEVGDDAALPDAVAESLPERFVICATNVSPHKNLDLLLHGWSRFENRQQWPLVIIGYGTEVLDAPPLERLRTWRDAQLYGVARRLGLGPHDGLHSLGYVPDEWVRPLIARAAALVMPSVTEGGGSFPVEEALAAGVPVLCSDIPVMREHMAFHSATPGWFDPWSAESIAQAARDFVAEYDERRTAARLGQLDPRPGWSDVACQYAEVLSGVARAPRSRSR